MITLNPETGEKDKDQQPLKELKKYGLVFDCVVVEILLFFFFVIVLFKHSMDDWLLIDSSTCHALEGWVLHELFDRIGEFVFV